MTLFEQAAQSMSLERAPLAERMRPRGLNEYVGQHQILDEGKVLRGILEREAKGRAEGAFPSLILWGPPGVGKTTLARLIAKAADAEFVNFSAVSSGVREARELIADARERWIRDRRRTLLFVDEIHRFNKAQQDAFLPAVEDGSISLIGATTENPSFELNNALLSRCRVFVLQPLAPTEVVDLLKRSLEDSERGLGAWKVEIDNEALTTLAQYSSGDARTALNALELAAYVVSLRPEGERRITVELAKEALQKNTILYDKTGEEHYNLISALHKSIRHSDPDASLYYLARMIEGGEDPLFIARRLVRAASEDVGLADPVALTQALAAKDAVELMGYPECDTALAQATVYLACAPKSNALYTAIKSARSMVKQRGPLPIPLAYRNAPTRLMEELGYGEGYEYDHDWPQNMSPQEALPDEIKGQRFYAPGDYGFEKEMRKRIEYFEKLRHEARMSPGRGKK
jgi:putative ATPase